MATIRAIRSAGGAAVLLIATVAAALSVSVTESQAAPPIRTSEVNPVPACVTPGRLMAFLADRNTNLAPRFRDIASWYKHYGEGWQVRWDYAFFQMAIETNFLTFRRGDGSRGDVSETQNNFAGIGAIGGGAHGERFADVATGVHAQIQHLVAYSGEHLAQPIATRTRNKQNDIIEASHRLGRPVTFGDLARRWAVDRAYGRSIDYIADLYKTRYCADGPARAAEGAGAPLLQPARKERTYPFPPPSGLGGPKPLMLAGPEPDPETPANSVEQLPWLVPAHPPAAVAPPKPGKKQATKRPVRVKTIWSRGDGQTKFDPARPTRPSSEGTWADVTIVRQRSAERGDAPTDLQATPSSKPHAQPDVASVSSQTSMLPTFRIAPLGTSPSRLGGPVPANPSATAATPPPKLLGPCRVLASSYGGTKTLLIRSTAGVETRFTALTVLDGFEKSMFDTYTRAEAADGQIVGEYPNRDDALADARVNCPDE